ncbi:predicted protein [Uncinocarpus reesii 1704]|uniref:Uncharacterized protein n=1 Tax=Uncinocarpus reesii (strain UAMH 1704) TaxID=336963 RepID=C4JK82_UNCRE|nr:uncharacterized protein UREG_02039 [Uncinocarpus reesii 1704]EEP77190.1 predicted protein [Uncinocarpus reesii 1704]
MHKIPSFFRLAKPADGRREAAWDLVENGPNTRAPCSVMENYETEIYMQPTSQQGGSWKMITPEGFLYPLTNPAVQIRTRKRRHHNSEMNIGSPRDAVEDILPVLSGSMFPQPGGDY